jgi:hypothetical protein
MREHFVMPSIRRREVPRPTSIRRCEDTLQPLDFSNGLLGVHSVPLSNMGMVIVKRSGINDVMAKVAVIAACRYDALQGESIQCFM